MLICCTHSFTYLSRYSNKSDILNIEYEGYSKTVNSGMLPSLSVLLYLLSLVKASSAFIYLGYLLRLFLKKFSPRDSEAPATINKGVSDLI